MPERLPEPDIAWYRLQTREIAVLAVLGVVFAALAGWALLHDSGMDQPKVESHQLPAARVAVNSASQAELTALPGIGEKKAKRIANARKEKPITSFDELAKAAGGIPKKDLERMRKYVSFE
jgi:DNA uptake protein ComE-like DNA-binding protein